MNQRRFKCHDKLFLNLPHIHSHHPCLLRQPAASVLDKSEMGTQLGLFQDHPIIHRHGPLPRQSPQWAILEQVYTCTDNLCLYRLPTRLIRLCRQVGSRRGLHNPSEATTCLSLMAHLACKVGFLVTALLYLLTVLAQTGLIRSHLLNEMNCSHKCNDSSNSRLCSNNSSSRCSLHVLRQCLQKYLKLR